MRLFAILLFIAASANLTAVERQIYPYGFTHESLNNQKLVKLRKTCDFEKYISAGKTEYEQMVLLKDWVYSSLKYSFSSPVPELLDSLEIMRLAGEGATFLCTSYAALYLECALSMGWTSRYIFLRMPNGKQHASVDIWSNQYKKWVYMDPTWNINVEENGIPMSIVEIRRRWMTKKIRSMRFVFAGGKKTIYFKSTRFPFKGGNSDLWETRPIGSEWLSYVNEVSIVGRNDLIDMDSIYSERYVIKDRNSQKAVKNKESIPVSMLFSPCNIPDYTVTKLKDDLNNVEIKLTHNTKTSFTPSFNRFEIEDDGKWITADHNFITKIKQLKNGIKVRTVNILGVAGPAVVIKNK